MDKQKFFQIVFKIGIAVLIISVLSLIYAMINGSTIAYREWVRIVGMVGALIIIHFYTKKEKEKGTKNLIQRKEIVKEQVTNSESLVEDANIKKVEGKEKQEKKLILRKAIVKEKVTNSEYLVEDILNKEIIRMVISGKMRMNYIVLNEGDKVYVTVSSLAPTKGRLTTETDFKTNKKLSRLRFELENGTKNKVQ